MKRGFTFKITSELISEALSKLLEIPEPYSLELFQSKEDFVLDCWVVKCRANFDGFDSIVPVHGYTPGVIPEGGLYPVIKITKDPDGTFKIIEYGSTF